MRRRYFSLVLTHFGNPSRFAKLLNDPWSRTQKKLRLFMSGRSVRHCQDLRYRETVKDLKVQLAVRINRGAFHSNHCFGLTLVPSSPSHNNDLLSLSLGDSCSGSSAEPHSDESHPCPSLGSFGMQVKTLSSHSWPSLITCTTQLCTTPH